jgi:hypothetical protein
VRIVRRKQRLTQIGLGGPLHEAGVGVVGNFRRPGAVAGDAVRGFALSFEDVFPKINSNGRRVNGALVCVCARPAKWRA